jgi:hypothetical protein
VNTNTTSRRGRYSAGAAAIATIAIIFGTAACGTETASDNGEPAAPAAPAAKAKATPHSPTSADAAERKAYAEQQEQYRRHLEAGAAAQSLKLRHAPESGREIPLP